MGDQPNQNVDEWLCKAETLAESNSISIDSLLPLVFPRFKDGAFELAKNLIKLKKGWTEFKQQYVECYCPIDRDDHNHTKLAELKL